TTASPTTVPASETTEPGTDPTTPPQTADTAPEATPDTTTPGVVDAPRVLAVGDSVMAGAAPAIQAAVPGITVDASVARQFNQGGDAVRWWMEQGECDVVVVHLGTNGAFGDAQVDELVAAAGGARLVFLEASAPRGWIELANERLQAGAARHGAQYVHWRPAVDAVGGPGE